MFYSLRGTLIHKELGMCVIECGGVGYKCFTTVNTQRNLPNIGEDTKIFTHLNVREDAMDLFGFSTKEELECFKILTSVSGVGVKVGLAILSEFLPEQVALFVASADSKMLTKAQGVGAKLACRIVLELKDKFKGIKLDEQNADTGIISASQNVEQAISALGVLGYSKQDVSSIISKLDSALSTEELIRLTLRGMAR